MLDVRLRGRSQKEGGRWSKNDDGRKCQRRGVDGQQKPKSCQRSLWTTPNLGSQSSACPTRGQQSKKKNLVAFSICYDLVWKRVDLFCLFVYHGVRLRIASHSLFKYKALLNRPTVAFSFFQAIQSRTILWTASLEK